MAEIIGVAASATQLGVACFSLMDVIRRIKGGASTLKRYHEQLQDLQTISISISQNPLLQTPEIGTQTEALLFIISDNCINSLLRKGRLLRSWGLLYKEQDLLETFVTLERQKSNLSLAIEQIQSKALYQIQNDIHLMATRDSQDVPATDDGSVAGANAVVCRIPTAKSFPASPSQLSSDSQGPTGVPKTQSSPEPQQTSKPDSENRTGPRWVNPVAGPGFDQKNGKQYFLTGPLSHELSKNTPQHGNRNPISIIGATSIGHGDMYNCNVVEFSGDVTGATEPDMTGDEWVRPRALPWPSVDPGTEKMNKQVNGLMVNGIIVRYKETSDKETSNKEV